MRSLRYLALVLGLFLPLRCSFGGSFSFTGTFANDTDVQFFTFTLLNPTAGVSLRTWSYAGGTNAASTLIPGGGFEPILNLYFSDGTQMNPGISGPCGGPLDPDPATGACADVYYPTERSYPGGVWDAGTYIVVLSENGNPGAGNLSDGFFANVVLGLPAHSNFTCEVGAPGNQGNPPSVPTTNAFCDQWGMGVQRTGSWALDINNVDSASMNSTTPEPATWGCAFAALLAGFAYRRRSR